MNTLNSKTIQKFSATLITFALLFVFPLGTKADTLEETMRAINDTQKKIDQLTKDITVKQNTAKTLGDQVAALDDQISQIELQIENTNLQVEAVQTQINNLNEQIDQATQKLNQEKENLKEYMRVMYEEGQVSVIEIVATSNSFSDYVNRSEYLSVMQSKVSDTIKKIKALKDELSAKKKEALEKQNQLLALKEQQTAQRNGLDSQRFYKDSLLSATKEQEQAFQSQLNDLYARKAALSAQFNETVSGGGSGYPYGNPPPANMVCDSHCTPDDYGYYIGECTSYAAWWRAAHGTPVPPNLGNANTWGSNAASQGYTVSPIPKVGSVMVFTAGWLPYGHVAIVEAVNGDGTVAISEYNWQPHRYTYRPNVNPYNYGDPIFIY